MDADSFDFVIVGAGSAGCVLAARLTESGRHTACVLEFGGSDRSVLIQMPAALSIPLNKPRYAWTYRSEPEPHLGGRRIACPRGKVLGGSSSINGMVYVRGNALDFDRWEREGAAGWGYRDVLPFFKRAESRQEGPDAFRGGEGPLATRYGPLTNPLHRAFVAAAAQAGHPLSPDVNGAVQEGFGRLDMTVKDGRRWSAADAYLRPAMRRPNLEVRTRARATSVLFEGVRATGVRFERDGVSETVRARREVILCGGPINTPQLLKLSGVGPGPELARHGIPAVRHLPGVGENLQDHAELYVQVACREPVSLFRYAGLAGRAYVGARWLARRDGPGASNHFASGGFVRSRPDLSYPDIQFHFLPLAVSYDGRALAAEHGFQAHVGPMRSKSRGDVRLASADPREPPLIRFNYMDHPDDWTEMRACLRIARRIFAQPAFDRFRGREIQPGAAVNTDEEIDGFVRDKLESAYHPAGTCRMGAPGDPATVVDPEARVVGTEALRVVDSSIMPSLTTGNLNAPTIMIGEKVADAVLREPG